MDSVLPAGPVAPSRAAAQPTSSARWLLGHKTSKPRVIVAPPARSAAPGRRPALAVVGSVCRSREARDLRRAIGVFTATSLPNLGCGDRWRAAAIFAQLVGLLIRSRLPSRSRSSSLHRTDIRRRVGRTRPRPRRRPSPQERPGCRAGHHLGARTETAERGPARSTRTPGSRHRSDTPHCSVKPKRPYQAIAEAASATCRDRDDLHLHAGVISQAPSGEALHGCGTRVHRMRAISAWAVHSVRSGASYLVAWVRRWWTSRVSSSAGRALAGSMRLLAWPVRQASTWSITLA